MPGISLQTRALLAINFNHVLCDNSRRSMQAACERWGAAFIEWNEATAPKYPIHPAALKCAVFEKTDADEALTLDADTVISSACPSPFERFDGPEFVAVINGNPERFGDIDAIRQCEVFEWQRLQEREPALASAQYVAGRYWNSGMMLARRAYHAEMFRLALDVVHRDNGCGWVDQTVLNMAAIVTGVQVRFANESWNMIHPEGLPGFPRMDHGYIWHFAGSPGRENILPRIQWQ